jgi:hypothetical protein
VDLSHVALLLDPAPMPTIFTTLKVILIGLKINSMVFVTQCDWQEFCRLASQFWAVLRILSFFPQAQFYRTCKSLVLVLVLCFRAVEVTFVTSLKKFIK